MRCLVPAGNEIILSNPSAPAPAAVARSHTQGNDGTKGGDGDKEKKKGSVVFTKKSAQYRIGDTSESLFPLSPCSAWVSFVAAARVCSCSCRRSRSQRGRCSRSVEPPCAGAGRCGRRRCRSLRLINDVANAFLITVCHPFPLFTPATRSRSCSFCHCHEMFCCLFVLRRI